MDLKPNNIIFEIIHQSKKHVFENKTICYAILNLKCMHIIDVTFEYDQPVAGRIENSPKQTSISSCGI